MGASIAVIGGGLAGIAAAARLAKLGHSVTVLEAGPSLGGVWAPGTSTNSGGGVDPTPVELGFPAPWRDLFRKSGRPLEAELSRRGLELAPAPATQYEFADGSGLLLPAGREQYTALEATYGGSTAVAWRSLVDRFDPVWQALRPLGYEAEPSDPRAFAAVDRLLRPWHTIADVATAAPNAPLGALVRSIAYRLGSVPERTPARVAVELSIRRTFGAWTLTGGRMGALVDLLAARLQLRRVEVRLGGRVSRIETPDGRAAGVTLADGSQLAVDAVVCTADPWQLVSVLLRDPPPALRRAVQRLRPALGPRIRSAPAGTGAGRSVAEAAAQTGAWVDRPVRECVRLDRDGVPVVTAERPGSQTVFDFSVARPDPAWGVQWQSSRWRSAAATWRPPSHSGLPGLFLAGSAAPAGGMPSAVVCSAALAAHSCHDYARMSVSRLKEATS